MDWNDTPEQRAFRADVRRFIDERLPQYYRDRAAKPRFRRYDPGYDWMADRKAEPGSAQHDAAWHWTRALAERGWIVPAWPKEYGGAGLGVWELLIYTQELSRAGAPSVGGQGVTQIGPTLIVHGTEEQRRKYLPRILSGEIAWAQGYSEPGAGSDLASLQTRAIRDGDEYVINGQKIWTSGGHHADCLYLLARTDPDAPKHRGITFLLIDDAKTPGVTIRPLVNMAWGHHFNEVFFEDVRIPADNRVGEENRGWYVGMTLLDYERANIDSAVADRVAIHDMLDFGITERGQVMTRIDDLETLRYEVADRYIETEVAHNLGLRIASMQASGRIPNYESSSGKLFGSETHQRIQRLGMKMFGLYSNVWDPESEYAAHGAVFTFGYVTTIPSTIAGGSSEIQRNIIATRGLGLPRG